MFDDVLYLDVLNICDVEDLRNWRNDSAEMGVYRTPFKLTFNMQQDFYENVISNRRSPNRFFAVKTKDKSILVAVSGLVYIEWENGRAEISLTVNPAFQNKGYGKISLFLTLREAFYSLRLKNVYGETYTCNPKLGFWKHMSSLLDAYETKLVQTKFFKGNFYDSFYFNFYFEAFKALEKK